MPDRYFDDPQYAAWYDLFCAGRQDEDFYLARVPESAAVLDIGCGTGTLLRKARQAGRHSRLTGLDPAHGMLEIAREAAPDGIEWILGDLSTTPFHQEFDWAIMTGHVFQVFLTDADITQALAAVHAALRPGGVFAFDTRNPAARAWERWRPENAREVTGPDGQTTRLATEVLSVEGELVEFTHTFSGSAWPRGLHQSTSRLRFLDQAPLNRLLTETGFTIDQQWGDFDGSPVSPQSVEIITLARRGPA